MTAGPEVSARVSEVWWPRLKCSSLRSLALRTDVAEADLVPSVEHRWAHWSEGVARIQSLIVEVERPAAREVCRRRFRYHVDARLARFHELGREGVQIDRDHLDHRFGRQAGCLAVH